QRLIGEYKNELNNFNPECPVFKLSVLDGDCIHAVDVLRRSAGADVRRQKAYALLFLCGFLPSARLEPVSPADENTLYPLVKYMEQHFREDISLDDVADALYMSRYRLSGIFSHALNMSFNDYLNSLRVNLAIQLMDTTDNSVTSIAFEVGFGNVRTFNRAFKKQCGITPTEFRKRHRG
ncbi:MAG: helix-turn-helix domain-containing protein, partial [Clostridia bacterium]